MGFRKASSFVDSLTLALKSEEEPHRAGAVEVDIHDAGEQIAWTSTLPTALELSKAPASAGVAVSARGAG